MNRRSSAPTLQDVAKMAGVSTATVSRCFNSPDRVVEATRERVLKIVEKMGYTPHFGGRALASNRSNTVGAIIPTMDNAIFARGIQ
ncbi:MAG: LacI family transcriptional regulator, partial [Gammaproteobacteria bacterium]